MKIIVDENADEMFPEFMPEHDALHVVALGWKGTKNGELLAKAEAAGFQLFITVDKNMPYQQSMKGRPFPLIVLDIHPNILANQVACIPMIRQCMANARPGQVCVIEGPHSKRHKTG